LVAGTASNSIAISNSTVSPYPITVGAVATNKVYGAADPSFTYTNTLLLFSDTLSGNLTRTAGTNAGTYTIGQGTLTNANYEITFLTNAFTITPKDLSITANNVTKARGVTLSSPVTNSTAFTSSGLTNNDSISSVTITYTDGASSGATAGTYTGVVVPSAPIGINTNNYIITYNAGDLTVDATPTITLGASSVAALSTTYGTNSINRSFTVVGGNLSNNITVTPPSPFEVSTNTTSDFTSSLVLTAVSNAVAETTVYVRLPATAVVSTNHAGTINVISDGATTQTVSIPASTVSPKGLTIGGLSASNRVYDGTTNGTVSGTPVYVGQVNGESNAVTPLVTWAFANKNVGTNKVQVASTNFAPPNSNYTITTQPTFSNNITQAALTLTNVVATNRVYAPGNTNISVGGTLVGVFSNDVVTPTFTASVASANAGTNVPVTVAVGLTGADAANYTVTAPTGVSVDITKASNTITFNQPPAMLAGVTNVLSATASSAMSVSYASGNTNVARISNNTVISVAPGLATITATQAGDGNYLAADPVSQVLMVTGSLGSGTSTNIGWNFGTTNANASPTNSMANLTVSALSQGNNNGTTTLLTITSPSDNTGASASYNAGAAARVGAISTATNGSAYFEFTLTPTNGYGFTLTAISFGTRSTGTGPTAYSLRSSSDGYSADLASGTISTNSVWAPESNSGLNVQAVGGTTFRIYGHSGTGSPGAGSANWRIDDLILTVSAAPILPGITASGTFGALSTTYGTPSSSSNSVVVSGGSLTSNVTATAPTGFQISSDGSSWSTNATFTQTDGFADGTLFLRLASNAPAATYSNQVVALTSGSASNSIAIATSTVNQKVLTVTAEAKSKVFGAADPALTYTSSGLVDGDSLSGSLARAAGENVGTYAISQGTLANANYSISFTGASLTITAAALPAVSWGTSTITNSNGVASFSYLYSGRSSNGISTTYSNSLAPTNAGYYTVVATSTDGNYSGSSTNTYFVAGPVLADDTGASTYELRKPQDNSQFYIDMNVVLANDKRIDSTGAVQTNGLSISAVTTALSGGSGTVLFTSPYILYTPTSGAEDAFFYTVIADGVSATAKVTVVPETNADVPSFTLQFVTKGTAVFTNGNTVVSHDFLGVPNKSYALEYSTNISAPTNWVSAGSINTGGTGSFTATLTATNTNVATPWNNSMFFRAKVNP
jgi:hypothetical protein